MWLLENYLSDFGLGAGTKEGAQRYDRTARILQNVQAAVFGDFVKVTPVRRLSKEPDDDVAVESDEGSNAANAVKGGGVDTLPSVGATLVGFGCILGAFALPKGAQTMKPLVLMEARKRDRSGKAAHRTVAPLDPALPSPEMAHAYLAAHQVTQKHQLRPMRSTNFPSLEDLSQGKAFSFKDYLAKTARQINAATATAKPSFMSIHQSASRGNTPVPTTLTRVPLYYHAEMQFVMSLVDMSKRLCSVLPKDARQQALVGELNLINHNLPASVCLPLWCHGMDSPSAFAVHHCHGGRWKGCSGQHLQHQRILRIPPSEAVVLNSAERVPFVIYVEVLNGADDGAFTSLIKGNRPSTPDQSSRRNSDTGLNSASLIRTPHLRSQSIHSPMEHRPSPLLDPTSSPATPIGPPSPNTLGNPLTQPGSDSNEFAERMRTAAIMLAQLTRQATQPGCTAAKLADITAIKAKLIAEMEALEKSRLLDAIQQKGQPSDLEMLLHDEEEDALAAPGGLLHKEDPSAIVFGEAWEAKVSRIREASPFGQLPGWSLMSVIVKSCPDMRQEQLACQLIEEMHDIWNISGLPIWVYPFKILVASSEGGLVETVKDSISIHSIKKAALTARLASTPRSEGQQPTAGLSLRDYYITRWGSPDSDSFINARDAFVRSLAGYSLVTYILQLRDRHNGNILVDAAGHLVHIDFGFMLSNAPGGYYGFESAPFKLTAEYIDLMGGLGGEPFAAFKDLVLKGFLALRRHSDRLLLLADILHQHSRLPCFQSGPATITQLRGRFQLGLSEAQVRTFVDRMITGSTFNVFTRLYDTYQYYSNGIL
jgi:phosphatidylinositol 4-kinase